MGADRDAPASQCHEMRRQKLGRPTPHAAPHSPDDPAEDAASCADAAESTQTQRRTSKIKERLSTLEEPQ
jgi:hypothetical protein